MKRPANKASVKTSGLPADKQRALVIIVATVVGISSLFMVLKFVDARKIDSYRDCAKAGEARLLETDPPICLLPDGRSFSE